MVDVVDILTLHLIWKFSNMSAQVAAADEAGKNKLRGQREALLERLVEFVSGGQSNVIEEVRKTVSEVQFEPL